jgi:hypothetical protein
MATLAGTRLSLSTARTCLLLEKWIFRLRRSARLTTRATRPEFSDQGRKSVVMGVALVSEFAVRNPRLDFAEQPLALRRS